MASSPLPIRPPAEAQSGELHIGMDAGSGRIVAATLTDRGVEDASQVAPSLDRISEPVAGDGAYDRNQGYAAVHERHPEAAVVAPPRPRDGVAAGQRLQHAVTAWGAKWRAGKPSLGVMVLNRMPGLGRPNAVRVA